MTRLSDIPHAARKRARTEDALQIAAVTALGLILAPEVVFFHVPNGGFRRKAEAARLSAMGVRAGVPDLLFLHAERCFGVELKSATGRTSPEQKAAHAAFAAAGVLVAVARSLPEILGALTSWNIPMRGRVTI